MIVTTTPSVEGTQIADCRGIAVGVDRNHEVINNTLMASVSATAITIR